MDFFQPNQPSNTNYTFLYLILFLLAMATLSYLYQYWIALYVACAIVSFTEPLARFILHKPNDYMKRLCRTRPAEGARVQDRSLPLTERQPEDSLRSHPSSSYPEDEVDEALFRCRRCTIPIKNLLVVLILAFSLGFLGVFAIGGVYQISDKVITFLCKENDKYRRRFETLIRMLGNAGLLRVDQWGDMRYTYLKSSLEHLHAKLEYWFYVLYLALIGLLWLYILCLYGLLPDGRPMEATTTVKFLFQKRMNIWRFRVKVQRILAQFFIIKVFTSIVYGGLFWLTLFGFARLQLFERDLVNVFGLLAALSVDIPCAGVLILWIPLFWAVVLNESHTWVHCVEILGASAVLQLLKGTMMYLVHRLLFQRHTTSNFKFLASLTLWYCLWGIPGLFLAEGLNLLLKLCLNEFSQMVRRSSRPVQSRSLSAMEIQETEVQEPVTPQAPTRLGRWLGFDHKCPMCNETVHIEDYHAHISSCIRAKNHIRGPIPSQAKDVCMDCPYKCGWHGSTKDLKSHLDACKSSHRGHGLQFTRCKLQHYEEHREQNAPSLGFALNARENKSTSFAEVAGLVSGCKPEVLRTAMDVAMKWNRYEHHPTGMLMVIDKDVESLQHKIMHPSKSKEIRGSIIDTSDLQLADLFKGILKEDGAVLVKEQTREVFAATCRIFPSGKCPYVHCNKGTRHHSGLDLSWDRNCVVIVRSESGGVTLYSHEMTREGFCFCVSDT